MALNSTQLADAIYKRLAFKIFSGESSNGLSDDLRESAGADPATSDDKDELETANLFHEGLSQIIAEEVLSHIINNGEVSIDIPVSFDNLQAITGQSGTLYVAVQQGESAGSTSSSPGEVDASATGNASIA